MKKAFILGIMAFFAIGMIQNANAQSPEALQQASQQPSTQAPESGPGAPKVTTQPTQATQATQTVPPRRVGRNPFFESQNDGKAIKPGQDMKGDARFNARNGRTGKRVSAQQTDTQNPEAQKPSVKTNSNNSNSGNSGNSGNSDSKKKGAAERPKKAH